MNLFKVRSSKIWLDFLIITSYGKLISIACKIVKKLVHAHSLLVLLKTFKHFPVSYNPTQTKSLDLNIPGKVSNGNISHFVSRW